MFKSLPHICETQGNFGILKKTEDLQIYLVQMLSFQCTFDKTPWIQEAFREMPSPYCCACKIDPLILLLLLSDSLITMCAQSLNRVWLFATLWTVACQAPLSMEFSRQEYWSIAISYSRVHRFLRWQSACCSCPSVPSGPVCISGLPCWGEWSTAQLLYCSSRWPEWG